MTSVSKATLFHLISAALGFLIAYIMDTFIRNSLTDSILFPYVSGATTPDQALSMADVVSIGLGALLAIFGGKLHAEVRYFGLGWFGGAAGSELVQAYTANQPTG